MKIITKYKANDGSEWTDINDALKRDELCDSVNEVMHPLGRVPKAVEDGKGWLQHDLETVLRAKDGIFQICREEGLNKNFQIFDNPGREVHPMSIAGRILDDIGGPLNYAWARFCRIDDKGREHQQCYYAYTAGPNPDHVCVESRVDLSTYE
jgi:hypothetical protein